MKEMKYRTEVHNTEELQHWIMDAAAYIWEPEMIQREVTLLLNE
jgi:methyl coenzyme M reductase subunit C-like uncharacterized protein (methanogenesis marker protein 7)